MPDLPVIPPPTNPEPMIPPRAAKWVWVAWSVLSATVIPSLAMIYGPTSEVTAVAMLCAMSLAPVIRYITTNSFATTPPVAMLVGVLALGGMTGCAPVQRVGKATVDCATPALAARVKDMIPIVLDTLGKPTQDWSHAVDVLVMSAGDVGICAVKAAYAEIAGRTQPPAGWMGSYLVSTPGELQARRAARWLEANGIPLE